MKRAAIWLAWGEKYLSDAGQSAQGVPIDRFLVCPEEEAAPEWRFTEVKRVSTLRRQMRDKSRLHEFLPSGYDSFVYLDTDTRVLGDISLGFEKAEKHGIALVPAPHYNLPQFFGFSKIMEEEGTRPADQMQYNAGVIFFSPTPAVLAVFHRWAELCREKKYLDNDQPFLTLAMEEFGFLPYVLSPAYNYRGKFGEHLVGGVRIWHNHEPPPPDLTSFSSPWPPRFYRDGKQV